MGGAEVGGAICGAPPTIPGGTPGTCITGGGILAPPIGTPGAPGRPLQHNKTEFTIIIIVDQLYVCIVIMSMEYSL